MKGLAFNTYRTGFKEITNRAPSRFLDRDWRAMRADATQRLELYRDTVDRIETGIRRLLADRVQDRQMWTDIKAAYSAMLVHNDDWELAETFFNSTTRRIFSTVGVDSKIEFVNPDFDMPPVPTTSQCCYSLKNLNSNAQLIKRILAEYQ